MIGKGKRDRWIGLTLGNRYRIEEAVRSDAAGVVYRAHEISEERDVQVRMLPRRDATWTERFLVEAKTCSLLAHPNTIHTYDWNQTRLGQAYVVTELPIGRSLREIILREPPMSPSRVLRVLMQCCASLDEAHTNGIIHGNVNPGNIVVQKGEGTSELVKLFGYAIGRLELVDLCTEGQAMDSLHFMSPERGLEQAIDSRSDLYSLGVLAYTMLSGVLPFEDEDPKEVLRKHQQLQPPPLPDAVPGSISMLVMSCLEKKPERRPPSVAALAHASRLGLTQLNPGLDLKSDPVLQNTLIHGGQDTIVETQSPLFSPETPKKITMLGAAGPAPAFPLDSKEEDRPAAVSHTSTTRIDESDQSATMIREDRPKLPMNETPRPVEAIKKPSASLTYPETLGEAPQELALRPSNVMPIREREPDRPKLVAPDQVASNHADQRGHADQDNHADQGDQATQSAQVLGIQDEGPIRLEGQKNPLLPVLALLVCFGLGLAGYFIWQ